MSGVLSALSGALYSPASGGFTPASLTSLLLWFEGDTQAYSDAGVTPAVNNDPVYQWNDQSASTANLVQSTSGARPTYNTGVLNSKAVVNYTTSTRYMDAAQTSDQKPVSVACVCRVGTIANLQYILKGQSGNDSISFGFYQSKILFWKYNTTIILQGGTTLSSSTWYRVYATYDGSGNCVVYLNGASDATGTVNVTFTDHSTRMGDSGGSAMVGEVAAFVKTGAVMSGTDITNLDNYWKTKYAL